MIPLLDRAQKQISHSSFKRILAVCDAQPAGEAPLRDLGMLARGLDSLLASPPCGAPPGSVAVRDSARDALRSTGAHGRHLLDPGFLGSRTSGDALHHVRCASQALDGRSLTERNVAVQTGGWQRRSYRAPPKRLTTSSGPAYRHPRHISPSAFTIPPLFHSPPPKFTSAFYSFVVISHMIRHAILPRPLAAKSRNNCLPSSAVNSRQNAELFHL